MAGECAGVFHTKRSWYTDNEKLVKNEKPAAQLSYTPRVKEIIHTHTRQDSTNTPLEKHAGMMEIHTVELSVEKLFNVNAESPWPVARQQRTQNPLPRRSLQMMRNK